MFLGGKTTFNAGKRTGRSTNWPLEGRELEERKLIFFGGFLREKLFEEKIVLDIFVC